MGSMNVRIAAAAIVGSLIVSCSSSDPAANAVRADMQINWSEARHIATVDPLFQSFNVEMLEVTGGRFWTPYRSASKELFEYRPPMDLSDTRLRNLTAKLAPAYMRVSGSWANATYFDDSPSPVSTPPQGFNAVLTAAQWDGANHFALDLNLQVVTSFAVSAGTRDADGRWRTHDAHRLIEYSRARGYPLAAAELMNEPNTGKAGDYIGIPKDLTAASFRDEFARLQALRNEALPSMRLAGPGAIHTPAFDMDEASKILTPTGAEILAATAPAFDIVSYHFYPALSQRCKPAPQTTEADALTEEFMSLTEKVAQQYIDLRERLEPGKPIWLTETAGAACGGNPWSSQFLDTFRYLEQQARLAKLDVKVVMHNTLSASDYGLIDERTHQPRPNYWAAVLWRQLMGERVLQLPIAEKIEHVAVYAHCLRDNKNGGVALLLINRDPQREVSIAVGAGSIKRYTLTAPQLASSDMMLNGKLLEADASGNFAPLQPMVVSSGVVAMPPASISFVEIDRMKLPACHP